MEHHRDSASSEELDKGNLAQNAFDDDPIRAGVRKTPTSSSGSPSNLGRRMKLGGIEVDREFPDLTYKYVVEGSNNGKKWKSLADGDTSIGPKRLPLSATAGTCGCDHCLAAREMGQHPRNQTLRR